MSSNDGSRSDWKEKYVFSAMTIAITAILTGYATYYANVVTENKKIISASYVQMQNDFQQSFVAIFLQLQNLSASVYEKKSVEQEKKAPVLAAVLSTQLLFHPQTGRWPSHLQGKVKELFADLDKFRKSVDESKSVSEFDACLKQVPGILARKDELVRLLRQDAMLPII